MSPPHNFDLSYLASFPNGSLDPSVDKLGLGPMTKGHTDAADINAVATPENGTYLLAVTNPSASFNEIYSGLFLTPVDFGAGTQFSARTSFIRPAGPTDPSEGATWVLGLMVRSGGAVASIDEPRAGLTLQVRQGTLRVNVPGAESSVNLPNLDQEYMDAVFDPDDPAPVTLDLLVDRISGAVEVTAQIGELPRISTTTKFKVFKADTGPPITAIGPAVVVAKPAGTRASVHVRDFRLSVPRT